MKLEPLTLQDLEKVKQFQKEHRNANFWFLLLFISFAFLCHLGSPISSSFEDYWKSYWFFLIGTPIFIFSFVRELMQLINEKNKLVGIVKIVGKTDYNDSPYILKFDKKKLKKVSVSEEIYGKFEIGENIYIEVTHRTKEILKIEKIVT